MSEENSKEFLEFQAYWRVAEKMIGKASKEELAVALRILAMQSAHYARKSGELELPDLTEFLATSQRTNTICPYDAVRPH